MLGSQVASGLIGWLFVFFVVVPVSIGLHEIGHLVPAKRFGVKCTQYMIGFGPTLWSRRFGETEYGVKAIPLGGYVRMLGMFPPAPGESARADSTGRLSVLIDQARDDAQRQVSPEDHDRLFYQRAVPKRLLIMLGGPLMNLVLAVVIATGLITLYGIPELSTTVQTVSKCVLPASAPTDATCETTPSKPAPAAQAGLLPRDVIRSFNGQSVTSWDQVRALIRANTGTPVPLVIERNGQTLTVTVTPLVDDRVKYDAQGKKILGSDGKVVTEKVGFLGVTPTEVHVRQPITAVPGFVGETLNHVGVVLATLPQRLTSVANAAFGGGERDPNGLVGLVGVGRLAGEVTAMQGTAERPITWVDKFAWLLSIAFSLNLALFAFNLIPLLPLDGGHVAGALWEGLKRRVARLRGRPDPGPVDVARALPLTYAVASLLFGMSALLIYADIVNPIKLG